MIKTRTFSRVIRNGLAVAVVVIASGYGASTLAQSRDPFQKAPFLRPKTPGTVNVGKDGKPIVVQDWSSVPSIEQRIDYYKRLRAQAAASGAPIPKVTSVLTLSEMDVTGIFRTPRGYAAMVEAKPIKLSYTIYPGEKFFDGQLVAVEENQLVFRKVSRTGKDKFLTSVENKPLRRVIDKDKEIQNTVASTQSMGPTDPKAPAPVQIVSPLDEMNKQPAAPAEKGNTKPAKKPAKVAKVARNN
jgi:hypothetical protein